MNATVYDPPLETLRQAPPSGKSVVISREILADLDTPVSAYLKLRGNGASFLLESAEGGERIARYSLVGSSPRRVLRVKNGRASFDGGPEHGVPRSAGRSAIHGGRIRSGAHGQGAVRGGRAGLSVVRGGAVLRAPSRPRGGSVESA